LVRGDDRDLAALVSQHPRRDPAHALAAASEEDDLAGDTEIHLLRLSPADTRRPSWC
jgi:hypothetical protein